jgi:hypothetical protein
MRTTLILLTVTMATHVGAQRAVAATIITSPAEFTSPTIFIGFEAFPNGEPIPASQAGILTDQWRNLGVLISDCTF